MCNLHKPTRRFLPRCSRTKPWRWQISQWQHKPTEHRLATAQSENAGQNIFGHSLAPADHGHRLANVGAPSNQNPLHDSNIYSRSRQKFYPNMYCSSQGFKVEESHSSATCRYPVDGHKKLATRMETKGGKKWHKYWINGVPTEWGGEGLDNDIVDMNENYVNYISYNPLYVKV